MEGTLRFQTCLSARWVMKCKRSLLAWLQFRTVVHTHTCAHRHHKHRVAAGHQGRQAGSRRAPAGPGRSSLACSDCGGLPVRPHSDEGFCVVNIVHWLLPRVQVYFRGNSKELSDGPGFGGYQMNSAALLWAQGPWLPLSRHLPSPSPDRQLPSLRLCCPE